MEAGLDIYGRQGCARACAGALPGAAGTGGHLSAAHALLAHVDGLAGAAPAPLIASGVE